jgi:hypothetical protein
MATGTRTARFIISAVDRTRETIRRITGNVDGLGSSFQRMGKLVGPALAGLATGAAVKGFASMIQRANDLTDSLRDTSIRLGIGVSDLQAYQLAAGNAGIEADQLTGIIGKLNKAAGEVKLGTASDKIVEAFGSLGITTDEIKRSNPAELFEQVIEGLGGIQDPATRAALAMQVFGKSGQTALTLVADGTGSLRESRQLLDELGLSLTRLDADNVDSANDALGTLAFVAQAAKQKIGAELSPAIAELAGRLLEAGKNGETMGNQIKEGVSSFVQFINGALIAGNALSAMFNLIQAGFAAAGAVVLGFASDFVTAIGTTAPKAFNDLLAATESGLTKMQQGFADFATSAANVVVSGMNKSITAVDTLVNAAAAGISKFIDLANQVPGVNLPSFSYSQTSEKASRFSRFPVDPINLGRVGQFGSGLADTLGGYSEGMDMQANSQLADFDADVRQATDALNSGLGQTAATLDEATGYANELTGAIGGAAAGGGGGSGGGGGAVGAVEKLKDKTDEAAKGFNQISEIGQAAFGGIERAIDEVTKTGKLDFADMARSILSDIAAIIAKSAILGGILGASQYGGNGQGLVGPLVSGFFSSGAGGASFAGGGFTGMGSRSGGVDGKGGFPAILHPNETVIDHARGQSMGGGVNYSPTIIVRETMPASVGARIIREAVEGSKAALAQINARGGNRRKAYGLG